MASEPQQPLAAGRRAFLRWATAIGGFFSTLLAGIPAARAFLSPSFKKTHQEKWIRLGEVDQFDRGVPTKIDFVDSGNDAWIETRRLRNVWIFTQDGEQFTVYNGRCTSSVAPVTPAFSTSRPERCWVAHRHAHSIS